MERRNSNTKANKPIYTYQFNVTKEGTLLDFLLEHLTKLSRNNVKAILSSKCVLVDGVVTSRHDYYLTKKSIVQISKYPIRNSITNTSSYHLDIIYEDDEFIVINKPSGLLSIASDSENEKTAYHYILEYVRKKNPKNQIFVVHRIDKDTSGVLMVAKNKEIRDALQDKWNDIVTNREYIALVNGRFNEKSGTYKSYLTETKTHMVYSSKGKEGKLATTNYKVIKEYPYYTLLQVNIDSGRKNQIRVQMAEHNHSVVGDEKYGEKKSVIGRLGLHASKLEFIHPINHKEYKFFAKLPKEFNKV